MLLGLRFFAEQHVILAVQRYQTRDLGRQIGLKPENAWGIVRCVVDLLEDKPDGRYVLGGGFWFCREEKILLLTQDREALLATVSLSCCGAALRFFADTCYSRIPPSPSCVFTPDLTKTERTTKSMTPAETAPEKKRRRSDCKGCKVNFLRVPLLTQSPRVAVNETNSALYENGRSRGNNKRHTCTTTRCWLSSERRSRSR